MKIGVNHFYYGYFLFTYTLYVILVKNAIDMVKNVYYSSREINHMLHFFIKSSFLPIDIL